MRKDAKGRNLRNGETYRSDGRYDFRYIDADGKRRSIYAHDLAELREKEKRVLRDKDDGITVNNSTLNDLFETYMQTKNLKASTETNYRTMWDSCIKDDIGCRKAVSVKTSDIKKFCAGMKNYSASTVKLLLGLIRASLETAVEDNIIRHNPAAGISPGAYGKSKKEKTALSLSQQENLLNFVHEHNTYKKHYPMLIIMLGTAIRTGELIALTWEDVDFEKREICINKQLVYKNYGDGYKFHETTPKTASGVRVIPMTQEVYDAFVKQKELGRKYVFGTESGRPMMPASLNSVLYNIVNAYNRREDERASAGLYEPEYMPKFSAHVLRHTGCTRMAEAGVQLKVISYILGHASGDITLSVYEHVTDRQIILRELEKLKNGVKMASKDMESGTDNGENPLNTKN